MEDFTRCVARGCICQTDLDTLEAMGEVAPLDPRALSDYLRDPEGVPVPTVCAKLREDMTLALHRGDRHHAATLLSTLRHYLTGHRVNC